MCGITGFYDPSSGSFNLGSGIVTKMATSIIHRGPDDFGVWLSDDNTLAFAHQRLAIVDVSETGHQPMISSTERYVIIFNGEIYNHSEIKGLLNESVWRGNSDTEVLLEAIEQWGLKKALRYCSGMFSFALWDQDLQLLSLVRDRLGEKPLYYGWCKGTFVFGSELKSIKAHPDFERIINIDAVTLYFNHGFIPAPSSIYEGIYKLSPGNILNLAINSSGHEPLTIESYWSIDSCISPIRNSRFKENGYIDELETLLTNAVVQQSAADVPLGSFLSGGIDSSLITSIMQKHSDTQIQTFSLGFKEEKYNEAKHAQLVSDKLGTAHHEFIVSPSDMQSIIPKLASMYDEPFGDPSAIPTFIVSQFAQSNVTVALTGDGGDELFGGYNRYHRSSEIWTIIKRVPCQLRVIAASVLSPFGNSMYNTSLGRKAERLSNYLSCDSLMDCYRLQTQASQVELKSILGNFDKIKVPKIPDHLNDYEAMMYSDAMTYLPDDILVKVDRAGMAVSLETRAPFLDHHVVEFAFNLPLEHKISAGRGKLILRDILAKYIPRQLFERPKMGFGLPIDDWLRGSLRYWAEELLSEKSLHNVGLLNVEFIRKRWEQHINGVQDWHYFLWDVLMFIEWFRHDDV